MGESGIIKMRSYYFLATILLLGLVSSSLAHDDADLKLKCEDVLAPEVCAQLREAAEKLKIKAELIEKFIQEAISEKITEAKGIIKYVRERIVDLATHTKCEDIFSDLFCKHIREFAEEFQLDVAEVEKF